jgi:DNA ligase D-like protein (predicted polymerase)
MRTSSWGRFVETYFGRSDPIGRRFGFSNSRGEGTYDYEIVGVVGDTKYQDARRQAYVTFFMPFLQGTLPADGSPPEPVNDPTSRTPSCCARPDRCPISTGRFARTVNRTGMAASVNDFAFRDFFRLLEVRDLQRANGLDGQSQDLVGVARRLGVAQALARRAEGAQHLRAIEALPLAVIAETHVRTASVASSGRQSATGLSSHVSRGAARRHPATWDTLGLMPGERELLVVNGREVPISNPRKVLFPEAGYTKLDLVRYYLAVADGALGGAGGRPNVLVRYPNGIAGEFFYQKRAPESRPDWIDVVSLSFPSGRTADEIVPRDAAALAWMANLACLELHPHPVRADDLDHPDELRVDLDPLPGIEWRQIREVAGVVRATLDEYGLTGWPKTSGSRGMHVNVRIHPRWTFHQVRRAALALAREVERRAPAIATSKWWKEERHGVFIDYNQNAKDRTVASAYSVRPRADARVSAPLTWAEIDDCDPADFTLTTMPRRFVERGDPHADIDRHACSLDALLEISARHEKEGLGDAPWPPQYSKQPGEPTRVQPSRARKPAAAPTKTGRRVPKHPLIEVARADRKDEALRQLDAWKARHPDVAAHLEPADVLVDAMRGRSSTWTRIRVNLRHVPESIREDLGTRKHES